MFKVIINILRIFLLPVTAVYYVIVTIKNFLYDRRILKQIKMPVKVISVGNISAGGTGKSPFIIYLAGYLLQKGFKTGIISRGYGRKTKGIRTVFDGKTFNDDTDATGDELNMIARNLKKYNENVFIIASEDRIKGAYEILRNFKPDYILLDDAFQHRKIYRDTDIVMIDTNEYKSRSLKNSLMIPSGILRESYSEIKSADIVIQNNKQLKSGKLESLLKLNKNLVSANYACDGFYDIKGNRFDIKNEKVIAISGIAKPESFFELIKDEGGNIINNFIFTDHHDYNQADIDKFISEYAEGAIFITTEKDFVKIKYFDKFTINHKVLFLKIKYELDNLKIIDDKIL